MKNYNIKTDYPQSEEYHFFSHFKRCYLLLFFCFLFMAPSDSYSQIFQQRDPNIESIGDAAIIILPASAMATTLLLNDRQGSWQMAKSFALNLVVTGGMKVLINKERPFRGGDYAFPSGHTSIAFQGASFFHRRYGFKYAIPAYVIAGFTGYSRMNAERHDGWDVLAGTVVGIGSTWFFTTPKENENMELTFSSNEDEWLVGFIYTF